MCSLNRIVYVLALVPFSLLGTACDEPKPWGNRVLGTISADHGGVEAWLPGARVYLQKVEDPRPITAFSTSSDERGDYRIDVDPWVGAYELCASAPGFQTACHPDHLNLVFGASLAPVRDLILAPVADAIRGKVMLEGESPCSEIATVELMEAGAAFSSTTTNDLGEYVLAQLPAVDAVDFEVRCAGVVLNVSHTLAPDERSGAEALDWLLPNSPPQISDLLVGNAGGAVRSVAPSAALQISATIFDPEGDPLTIEWRDDADSVVSANAASIPWTAPNSSQIDTIHVRVDDGRGGVSRAHLSVRIGPAEDRFIGHVFDEAGDVIVGAAVVVDTAQSTTDAAGYFGLSVAAADFHLLSIRQPGYAPYFSRMSQGGAGLEIQLRALNTFSVDPTQDIEVWDGERGVAVFIPADSLEDETGATPSGLVDIGVYSQDDTSTTPMGSRAVTNGAQTDGWESFQSAAVEITDAGGTSFDLASGREAVVGFQAPDVPAPPPMLQLARLDEATGVWDDQGQAELIGSRYEAVVPGFSAWSTGAIHPDWTACVRVDVNTGSLQLPARVTLYWKQSLLTLEPQYLVGRFTLHNEKNAVFRLPPNKQLIVEVNPFSDPDVVLNTYQLGTGGTLLVPEPPYPYSTCQQVKVGTQIPAERNNQLYLSRLGWGSESEAQSYYQSIGAIPAKDTFAKWMAANGFTTGDFANDVTFFNPNELGLTRRANCKSQLVQGQNHYACYVTKYGKLGAPHVESLWDGLGGLYPGDTVAMEFGTAPGTGSERIVKFYIYAPHSDPSQQVLKTHTAFDTDGDVKHVPNVCLHCHGIYSGQFVVFDALQYEYLGIGQSKLSNVQEQLRQFNSMVDIVLAQTPSHIPPQDNPARELIRDIYGTNSEVHVQGSLASEGLHGNFEYDEITKPYCRTCHMWSAFPFTYESGWVPSYGPSVPDICAGVMPHAMAPQLALWSSSDPFLPGTLNLGCLQSSLNAPPVVQITSPADGSNVDFGGLSFETFTASATDAEDGNECCLIKWTSDEGSMGFGTEVNYVFSSSGSHSVCAKAFDAFGKSDEACITVNAQNTAPVANIQLPTTTQVIYEGEPTSFWGEAYDVNAPYLQLPCDALSWTFPFGPIAKPPPTTGCQPVVTFPSTGLYTVRLEANDGFAIDVDTVNATVLAVPPGSPPGVNILSPQHGGIYPPDLAMDLDALVSSHGGGPITLQWTVDDGGGPVTISTSNNDTWVPSSTLLNDCGSEPVEIGLEATDGNGMNSDVRSIFIGWPPC
jgi:hypothetical protein